MADQKISVGTDNPVGIFPVLFKLLDLIFSHRLSVNGSYSYINLYIFLTQDRLFKKKIQPCPFWSFLGSHDEQTKRSIHRSLC